MCTTLRKCNISTRKYVDLASVASEPKKEMITNSGNLSITQIELPAPNQNDSIARPVEMTGHEK